jgi:hypothetical protein
MTEPTTYEIRESKLPEAKKTLDGMIRRAQKLGVESLSYSVGDTFDKPMMDGHPFRGNEAGLRVAEDKGLIYYVRYVRVTVNGPSPMLSGWEFVATLQHLTDDQGKPVNILRVRPGFETKLPAKFKTVTAGNCDHCHQVRMRKDTYVVRNVETGEWKQIGSSCLKDFCGGNDPRNAMAILEWNLKADDALGEEGESMGGGTVARWSMREFLATTAAVIRQEGWLSRGKARNEGGIPTADLVVEALHNKAR